MHCWVGIIADPQHLCLYIVLGRCGQTWRIWKYWKLFTQDPKMYVSVKTVSGLVGCNQICTQWASNERARLLYELEL